MTAHISIRKILPVSAQNDRNVTALPGETPSDVRQFDEECLSAQVQ